jgi:hypothetical protein
MASSSKQIFRNLISGMAGMEAPPPGAAISPLVNKENPAQRAERGFQLTALWGFQGVSRCQHQNFKLVVELQNTTAPPGRSIFAKATPS